MKCPQCRYNTLCWAGQLFNTHTVTWCPDCHQLQVCERVLEPGVRALERASPSDPNVVFTGPASLFQKGVKPFRDVFMIFECEQRTFAGAVAAPRKTGLRVNPGDFDKVEYVTDPGPPQVSEWAQVPDRSLQIKKCVVCGVYDHYKRLPISVRMLDQEPSTVYACASDAYQADKRGKEK